MSALQRHATALGLVSALILIGIVVTTGFLLNPDPLDERTTGLPIADEDPLPGGTRMTLDKASSVFPVPLYRPDTALASDSNVSELWVRLGDSPEVWIQYRSGIVVLIRPSETAPSTKEFADAQVADGVPGHLETVAGVESFVVPQTEAGSGSVQFVLDRVAVTVIGFIGDFSIDQLTDAAESIVATSGAVAASTVS